MRYMPGAGYKRENKTQALFLISKRINTQSGSIHFLRPANKLICDLIQLQTDDLAG